MPTLLLLLACTPEPAPPSDAAPPAEAAPTLVEVHLPVLRVEDAFRWDTEFRGLATLAIEAGLADLPGVVPAVMSQGQPLSVAVRRPVARRVADARFIARGTAEALELELELCVAGEGCTATLATTRREAPWDAFATLLAGAAETLGVPVSDELQAHWRQPGSTDTYAELITGRAAAMYYGIAPVPEVGQDGWSVAVRAVNIDPRQPLALWTLARWEMGMSSDGGKVAENLARAAIQRPWSPMLLSDRAIYLGLLGKHEQAVLAWEELRGRWPTDPRFFEPQARALHAAGHDAEAHAVLALLPEEYAWDPAVAALQVDVTAAVEGTEGLDPLLIHWQRTDSRDPEPLRRRIELRVQQHQHADALLLIEALRTRAPGPMTDALEVALLVAVDRLADAAAKAPEDVAARLQARQAWEADPGVELDAGADPIMLGARLEAALWRGEAPEALALADQLIRAAPHRAEGYSGRARALELAGRPAEATAAWQQAWQRDPAEAGGPVSTTRIQSTFRYQTAL